MSHWMTRAGASGTLTIAHDRITAVLARAERLADDTAWECTAERLYRAELAQWVALLHDMRTTLERLEVDARASLLAAGGGLP